MAANLIAWPLAPTADIARHRDMYQELFKQLFVYLNKGFGPDDVVAALPRTGRVLSFQAPLY